jgi:hypothetical protein
LFQFWNKLQACWQITFILSDIGLAYLIYKIIDPINSKKSLLAASLFLFNPVLI